MRRRHAIQLDLIPVGTILVAFTLAACGGGSEGVGGLPVTTPTPETAEPTLLSFQPTTVEAGANTPITLTGTGLVPPVTVEFVAPDGSLMGAPMSARIRDGGTRADSESPVLPDIEGTVEFDVRVRGGDGTVLEMRGAGRVEGRTAEVRTIDGSDNNRQDAAMGSVGTALRADVLPAYDDGIESPAGAHRPGARAVSSACCDQEASIESPLGLTDMFWLWGQFLDHDISLTPEAEPAEAFDIEIPLGDPWFDPDATGEAVLPFHRSTYLADSGTGIENPRRQINEITAWIDASNVYGSDAQRARALRTLDGTGRLATSDGNLLPFNTQGLPNAPSGAIPTLFLAGDVRANEQIGLTSLHTLFVREHNRVADDLRERNPHLTGDQVYELARRWVGAEMQVITYREFLPLLLGPDALPDYRGYEAGTDAQIGLLFSTACYRFGHSMVSGEVLRLDAGGETIAEGNLSLRDAFFNPGLLVTEGGIDPVLRGFAAKRAQALDPLIVDDLRNFLFGAPGAGGLDLAALNLQRGRDHGLPDYNSVCEHFGLNRSRTFDDVTANATYRAGLASVYESVDDMDTWIAALCEDRVPGAAVGRLLQRVLTEQFRRLRDGDRFWYRELYAGETLQQLESTTLADVIRRNTDIGGELPGNVFVTGDQPGEGPGDGRPPRPRDRPPAEIEDLMGNNRFFR